MEVFILLFQLIIGHCVGDYVLQPGPMASGKSRHSNLREQYGDEFPQWYYWLSAHAMTHAGIVILITGNYFFAILEFFSHALIDFCKSEKWITLHQDQLGHMIFKIIYCVIFYMSMAG